MHRSASEYAERLPVLSAFHEWWINELSARHYEYLTNVGSAEQLYDDALARVLAKITAILSDAPDR
jgi:hypothetical protein